MALGGAALFAVNGTVSKVALTGSDLTAVDYTQVRTAGGFLGLALVLAVFARDKLRITRRDIPFFVFYGMFSFALVQWLYFVAIEHLPIGIALLIQFTGIVLVALWGLVWHAQVRPRVWGALSLTLVGLALVSQFWLGWTLSTVGVVAAAGGAIALAVYLLAGERAVERRDPLTVLCFSLLFAALVWSVVQPWWSYPFEELTEETSLLGNLDHLSAPVWTLALWTIVFGTIAPLCRAHDRRTPAPCGDAGRDHDDVRAGGCNRRRLGLARGDALDGRRSSAEGSCFSASCSPKRHADVPCPGW